MRVALWNLVGMNHCDVPSVAGTLARFDKVECRLVLVVALLVGLLSVLAGPVLAVEIPQAEIENRRCLNCHGQSEIGQRTAEERRAMVAHPGGMEGSTAAARPGLFVTPETLMGSVHKDLSCVSCHADAQTLPHAAKLRPASCTLSCHTEQGSDYLQSKHAEAAAKNDPNAPTCGTCHGGHDILPKTDKNSRTYPLNSANICSKCHSSYQMPSAINGKPVKLVQAYLDSVHGQAVKGGMVVAATCADCHTSHRVLPSSDAQSSVNRQNVANTCGQCHPGVTAKYQASIHGQKLAADNPRAPSCTGCHTAHEITRVNTPAFMEDIVSECGTCHDTVQGTTQRKTSLYETYRRSYHGQTNELGSARVARCSSCHGSHDILPVSNPASRLYGENRIATCQQCHPQANANFAEFEPHADYHDGIRFPILHGVWLYFVVIMSASFGFFGLHCIFWFIRSIIERLKHGPHLKHPAEGPSIQRFSRVDRVNHAFVIISFFGLALTGLPLLYADKRWAQGMITVFGGVGTAGIEHRIFAVILILNFVVHGFGIVNRIRKYSLMKLVFGPATMLPRLKDLKDLLGMYKWFFTGGKKPKFDRWTYWEKFDYMAEVGGSGIIGLSGLMLWFPGFFSRFLPGWMFNVATIVHGYEALLAIGFIFTIHFFNAHLRLEKFPVDDVIFTGRLTEEEFKHERPAEYQRVAASGELESLRVKPPHHAYRVFAVIVGILAMAIGTTLVALIILAGLSVL